MTLSTRTLLRAALLLVVSLCLPNFASALTDQEPPTAVIVSEDFVPPIDDWAPVSGTWSINAGAYSSTATGAADISTLTEYRQLDPAAELTPKLAFAEFSVSARVRTKGTTAGQLAGLVYQYQDPANYLEAVVSATGVVSLRRLRFGGSFDTLGQFILGSPRDTWVDLEVQWKNGRTTLLVNGQIVLANVADLTSFTSGQVGVVSHGAMGQFDKVRVTTPFGDQPYVFTPVVWQDGAVMPISVPPNSDNGLVRAINDHGAVLARTVFRDVFPGRVQAYIWHEGETTLLARLSPTFNQSDPHDINNAGVAVGVSFSTAETATIWDGTRAQELDTLIDRQDPRQPFVHLDTPYRINNRGQIVARGLDSRQAQGLPSWYLLTPVTQQ